jgi:lycopene beta-cyclase
MESKVISIAGGGLSGCLLLSALKNKYPEQKFELFEMREKLCGNHTWCFHDADLPPGTLNWLAPLISKTWDSYEVRFPKFTRVLNSKYHCIKSEDLVEKIETRFKTELRLGQKQNLAETDFICTGWTAVNPAHEYGWQKFVGLEIELENAHELVRPILKDATVEQIDGYRFVYTLPLSPTRVLIEDTYYSNTKDLDVATITLRIRDYSKKQNWKIKNIIRSETGCLPLDLEKPTSSAQNNSVTLGAASQFLNPVTGYTLPFTLRSIQALLDTSSLEQNDLAHSLAALHKSEENIQSFYRLLNKMMFRAAKPELRYKILERFYGLNENLIERFYSGQNTFWDGFRILSGKPPVPVLAALRAILK